MCCYCDRKTDAEIARDIAALIVPDDVYGCDRGWAKAARIWAASRRVERDEDVEDWVGMCRRRAIALAGFAIGRTRRGDHRVGR
jgi:hypothetical protein